MQEGRGGEKEGNSYANNLSNQLYICVFAFLVIKIITRRQLYQQLVRLILNTCFHFFNHKNCNIWGQLYLQLITTVVYTYFCFSSCKDCNMGGGQLYQQLVRLVVRMFFCFSTCKNCNTIAASQVYNIYLFLLFYL